MNSSTSARIRLQTLGTIDLTADGRTLSTILVQPKRFALLAYLATAKPQGFHSRDAVLALFWPESDTERARNSLRQSLHQLRRALGESTIVARGEREIGVDDASMWCDAVAFDLAIAERRLADALEVYRGDFLPGLHVQEAPEAVRWIDEERQVRRRQALDAALELSRRARSGGQSADAVAWGRRALELEPADESAIRATLEALADAGDVSGAMDVFADFTKRLSAEFGIKPSVETTRLMQRIAERPASTTAEVAVLLPKASATDVASRASSRPGGPRRIPSRRITSIVAGAALLMMVAWASRTWWSARTAQPGSEVVGASGAGEATTASVAVLPFANLSGDPQNAFLADGMTEELINLLAQRPELQVAARTSAFAWKDKNARIDSIAKVLRVRHVVEGSMRQSGTTWRITVQLIDAETGYHRWSANFDSRLDDVIAVQDSIGRAIVRQLRIQLAGALPGVSDRRAANTPVARAARDSAAHLAAMRGWRVFRLNTPEAYAAAATQFADAIRRDSSYGYAYAGLATVRHWQAYFRQLPTDSTYEVARRLAERAVALDSTLVDAWMVLARTAEVRDRDDARASSYYARAIASAPSDPRPYSRRASLLARTGRAADALASAQRAVELDPASPAVYADLANLYADMNRFGEAAAALREALQLDPGHPILLGNLALQYANQQQYGPADSVMQLVRRQRADDPVLMGQHVFILTGLGRTGPARALLDSAERRGLSPTQMAVNHYHLGDTTAVYRYLERALAEHDDGLVAVLDTSMFAGLRGQPRFRQIVARAQVPNAP